MQVFKSVTIRACVQKRSGGGGIPVDDNRMLETGEAFFPLGEFETGSYVVRMIVQGKLIKNLTFEVK